ncbi:hypothetical protein MPER_04592, partial [Moniliophthora perniciosa FA553]
MYRTIIAVTLESGLLYFTFLFVSVSVSLISPGAAPGTVILLIQAICLRIWASVASIVSTIVIVCVTLGISLDSVESAIISIRTATAAHEEVIDISRPPDDLTQKGRDQPLGTPECVSHRG